jgi:uncharacterized repeat protein (TIGR02543 family)
MEVSEMIKKLLLIVLVAMFLVGCSQTESEYVVVSFETNGGWPVEDYVLVKGRTNVPLPIPSKTGNRFAGWYLDNSFNVKFDETQLGQRSVHLYAKWEVNTYTLSFNSNGGSPVNSITAQYDTKIYAPIPPTKYGAVFGGWFIDTELIHEYTYWRMPGISITLHAKWIANTQDI